MHALCCRYSKAKALMGLSLPTRLKGCPILLITQELISASLDCQPLALICHSRTGLQLPTTFPCPATGPAEPVTTFTIITIIIITIFIPSGQAILTPPWPQVNGWCPWLWLFWGHQLSCSWLEQVLAGVLWGATWLYRIWWGIYLAYFIL